MTKTRASVNALTEEDRRLTVQRALILHDELGSWGAVAKAMRPYLKLSRTAWWHVAQGKKITLEKCNALLHWPEIPPPPRSVRKHPERKSINVRRETWERLHRAKELHASTWDYLMDSLLSYMKYAIGPEDEPSLPPE